MGQSTNLVKSSIKREIRREKESLDLQAYRCGCVAGKKDGIRWEIIERCPAHRLNVEKATKRAEKKLRRLSK